MCVKAAAWLEDEIELTADGLSVDPDLLGYELSEEDHCAVEAAVELTEGADGEVVLVSVGDARVDGALRRGLAMGAGRAVRLEPGIQLDDALGIAALLAPAVSAEQPQLVLCGAQSPDAGSGATGGALAAHLGLPCATVVSRLSVEDGHAVVHRALEGGLIDVVDLDLPAVVTVTTGFYAPRRPKFRALKRADDQPLDVRPADAPPPSSVMRRVYRPSTENTAHMLDGPPADVAATVAGLIAGRVS